ncbi:MAG: ATP-binding protein [Patescibacteria group bacterium]
MSFLNFFKSSSPRADFGLEGLAEIIISALHDGIIAYDSNFKILIFNPAAEKIFNISSGEIITKHITPSHIKDPRFKIITQVFFPSLAPLVIKKSEPNAYPQVSDFSFEDPRIELRCLTSRIIDSKGLLIGYVKIIIDRTREMEILRSKNEFISVAAHQLRTPLTAVNWALETLNKENLTDNQKEMASNGLGAATVMLKIVNDLLDVSKIEEGRYGYNFEDTNIIDFVKGIIAEVKEIAAAVGIKIYLEPPKESELILKIDSQKLGMVLFNLIDNAIRYNVKNGEVIVSVERLKNKPYIQIGVKDTGIGISADDIDKLFSKFFRGDNAIKSVPNGSGLGLYIAKNVVKRHGGEISVESELNRGSTFYFTIPTDQNLIPPKEFAHREE